MRISDWSSDVCSSDLVDRANAADAAMPMIAASIVVDAQRAALPCRAIVSLPFSLRHERRSRGRAAIGRVPLARARPFGLVFPVLRAGRQAVPIVSALCRESVFQYV